MRTALCLLGALVLLPVPALADTPVFNLDIRDHRFSPETLEIPAGTKVKLIVQNHDSSVEEFESHDLNREKLVPGNAKTTIYIGPLKAGRYSYFGEFTPQTAQGVIVAK